MVKMYVDSREPRDIRRLAKKLGFIQMALTYGDYTSEHCVFERKDMGDLVNSIFARHGGKSRLFDQLDKLFIHCRSFGKVGWLLVTGKISTVEKEFSRRKQKLNRFAIYGAIGSVTVRYDFSILWTEQPAEEWLQEIRKIAEKVEEGKLLLPKRKKLKEYSKVRSIAIVSRALDVSPRLAQGLVRKFGTLYGVVYALKHRPQDILVMEGIGRRTFEKMRETCGIGK